MGIGTHSRFGHRFNMSGPITFSYRGSGSSMMLLHIVGVIEILGSLPTLDAARGHSFQPFPAIGAKDPVERQTLSFVAP